MKSKQTDEYSDNGIFNGQRHIHFRTQTIFTRHAWQLICLNCLLLGMTSQAQWIFDDSDTGDTGAYSSDYDEDYGDWGGGWYWATESAASGTVSANSGGVSASGSVLASATVFDSMGGSPSPTALAYLRASASYSWSGVPGQQTPVQVTAYVSVSGSVSASGQASRTLEELETQCSSAGEATGLATVSDEDGTNVFRAGGTASAAGAADPDSPTGTLHRYVYWISGGGETHDAQSYRTYDYNLGYYIAANYWSYGEYSVEFDDTYEVSGVGLSFNVSVDLSSGGSCVASGVSTSEGSAQGQASAGGQVIGAASVSVGL